MGARRRLTSHYGVLTIRHLIESLRLDARLEMILARGHDRSLPDALSTAECGQGRIRQVRAGRRQFFMDSHEIALARSQQIEDLLTGDWPFAQQRVSDHLKT